MSKISKICFLLTYFLIGLKKWRNGALPWILDRRVRSNVEQLYAIWYIACLCYLSVKLASTLIVRWPDKRVVQKHLGHAAWRNHQICNRDQFGEVQKMVNPFFALSLCRGKASVLAFPIYFNHSIFWPSHFLPLSALYLVTKRKHSGHQALNWYTVNESQKEIDLITVFSV